MAFQVGQKVVCIKDGPWVCAFQSTEHSGPHKGEVCIIKDISTLLNLTFLHLNNYETCAFVSHHFRPIVDQGMKTLRAILETPPTKQKVDA